MVGSREGDLGFIDTQSRTDYGKKIHVFLQSGIICPGGSPNDNFLFNSFAPILVPQTSGSFTIGYKIDGKLIETLEFSQVANLGGNELGEEFTLGVSPLGGIPQVACDSRRIKGYGMMYEFFIDHGGTDDTGDGFELLGILIDVDKTQKTTGRTVA